MSNPRPCKRTQFKPGQSGNPGGYSNRRRITDKLLELITEKQADKALAGVWLTAALKGDYRFFRELLDRIEGPIEPPQIDDPTGLKELVEEAEKRAEQRRCDRETDGAAGSVS